MDAMARYIEDREAPRHKKKRGKHLKKPWKFEARFTGDLPRWAGECLQKLFHRNWREHGAFVSKRGRNDAMARMKSKGGLFGGEGWELRRVDPPPSPSSSESH